MNENSLNKFQDLLRTLFQFDCADLDFGIYRIMNHKRQVIERWIAENLPKVIAEELARGALAKQGQAQQALAAARQKVLDALGEDALDAEGNLAEAYRNTPAGKAYLEAQAKARGARSTEALEAAIYNYLYTFFSRYWQDGDFISKRRYSRKERYAIPYNGEEVYLYWANHDQYYIKTGEYFTDYTYQAPNGVTVHFKLQQADVEQNNVKSEKRFFLPVLEGIAWDERARTLTIPFQFRPLTEREPNAYGQKNQQEAIVALAVMEIPKRVKAIEALAALTAEYGKAIIFDYSYKYFYGDGFGKDFRILNLRDGTRADQTETLPQTETLLLGNLLSFYEQLRLFAEQTDVLRPYNLEKPLCVFVGSTVNAVYTENKKPRSDVLTVVRFLHHVLNDRAWAIKTIQAILDGKTGLDSPDGQDVFAGRFDYLRESGVTPEQLYDDLLLRVFHAPAGGGVHLCEIKSSPGELGLKAAGAEDYFGLIYIGDTAAFKKLLEGDSRGITLEEDAIATSLFERINRPNSNLHILIGAKKFMEGWNSWRVATMGLLNIGKEEGSQIIQLFGRGVRLKGKALSLKRSAAQVKRRLLAFLLTERDARS